MTVERRRIRKSSTEQFVVLEDERAGHRLIVLHDAVAGTEAIVVPTLGFSCIGFRVTTPDGVWPVLAEPPDGTAMVGQTTRYGVPILFPWPNRIRKGRFFFAGTDYQMPTTERDPNANHGFARTRAWTIDSTEARDDGAFCRASVRIGGEPDDPWPFPVRLSVLYRLVGPRLMLSAEATNVGRGPLPMGFGLHPWFTLPLGPNGPRERCEVRVPSTHTWELDANLPTGNVIPVTPAVDARRWLPLDGVALDDVYTELGFQGEWFAAEVRDPDSGRRIAVWSDEAFREHVVFAPPNRSVICLEPYTCPTDAFNLHARGIETGLVVLPPGGRWRGTVEIQASFGQNRG